MEIFLNIIYGTFAVFAGMLLFAILTVIWLWLSPPEQPTTTCPTCKHPRKRP